MTQKLIRAALIAALYVVLCIVFQPISYGVVQLRLAEGLTLLPILYLEAVPGLFVGALVANMYGGLGLVDVMGGSLTTLLAAAVTYYFRGSILSYLSPVVFNAFLVSAYLHLLFKWPYWLTVLSIGLSEGLVVFTLGHGLVTVLKRYGAKLEARSK
ncbi:MAG TPA: QueT transporter family protein [Clostridia bacterium]|nr:QueT transporter family protein [Clostridia bacterium]